MKKKKQTKKIVKKPTKKPTKKRPVKLPVVDLNAGTEVLLKFDGKVNTARLIDADIERECVDVSYGPLSQFRSYAPGHVTYMLTFRAVEPVEPATTKKRGKK